MKVCQLNFTWQILHSQLHETNISSGILVVRRPSSIESKTTQKIIFDVTLTDVIRDEEEKVGVSKDPHTCWSAVWNPKEDVTLVSH